ncbi:MAG: hypothetical protein LQ347_006082, partial [Umbilicaria vellea]
SATELSLIARQGSGSACRSLLGGYVAWDKGSKDDGTDSVARVVAAREHWPEMRALILVVSAEKKGVSSTTGMQTTVKTSSLFKTRTEVVVPQRMKEMEKAILERDFETFGKVTMAESNSFHATCLDTEPPIFYLNDVSRAAIRVVEGINKMAGKVIAAYTFDAGPNAVIYYLEENNMQVAGLIKAYMPTEGWHPDQKSDDFWWEALSGGSSADAHFKSLEKEFTMLREGVNRVIQTRVGEGPISVDEHLIDEKGEPKSAPHSA